MEHPVSKAPSPKIRFYLHRGVLQPPPPSRRQGKGADADRLFHYTLFGTEYNGTVVLLLRFSNEYAQAAFTVISDRVARVNVYLGPRIFANTNFFFVSHAMLLLDCLKCPVKMLIGCPVKMGGVQCIFRF